MPSSPRRARPRPPKRKKALRDEERARLIYRDPDFLRQFLTERGRIKARSATGLSRVDQARLTQAVKVARELALLPYAAPAEIRDRKR
jgi:small subunit ribosomal protein S18